MKANFRNLTRKVQSNGKTFMTRLVSENEQKLSVVKEIKASRKEAAATSTAG